MMKPKESIDHGDIVNSTVSSVVLMQMPDTVPIIITFDLIIMISLYIVQNDHCWRESHHSVTSLSTTATVPVTSRRRVV